MAAALEIEQLWHHRAPGGESLVDVAARVAPVVSELADRHLGEQVIVVSHGGVMAAKNADGFRLDRDGAGWCPPKPLFDAP